MKEKFICFLITVFFKQRLLWFQFESAYIFNFNYIDQKFCENFVSITINNSLQIRNFFFIFFILLIFNTLYISVIWNYGIIVCSKSFLRPLVFTSTKNLGLSKLELRSWKLANFQLLRLHHLNFKTSTP